MVSLMRLGVVAVSCAILLRACSTCGANANSVTRTMTPAPSAVIEAGKTAVPVDTADHVQVAIGSRHLCVRLRDGRVRCRGANDVSQLGDPSPSGAFVQIPPATSLCAGYAHTCALTAGVVRCWGASNAGQRGTVPARARDVPNEVAGLPAAIEIACGREHTCSRHADGSVRCWGSNSQGQLGNGARDDSDLPVAVAGVGGAVRLAAGGGHTCALVAGGRVWCWGANDVGQLGSTPIDTHPHPAPVAGLSDVTQIAVGMAHTCALAGSALCWGWNVSGQVGPGNTTGEEPHPVPKTVAGVRGVVELSLGHAHSCARTGGGGVWCWGANDNGQLGQGMPRAIPDSVQVEEIAGAVAVVAASDCTCAVRADDVVLCWGKNQDDKLGAQLGPVVWTPTALQW